MSWKTRFIMLAIISVIVSILSYFYKLRLEEK